MNTILYHFSFSELENFKLLKYILINHYFYSVGFDLGFLSLSITATLIIFPFNSELLLAKAFSTEPIKIKYYC